MRSAGPPCHLPGSLLLRAQQGQPPKPQDHLKASKWLSTHQRPERARLSCPQEVPAIPSHSGQEGGLPPAELKDSVPHKQRKRRAVKGSAEVPSLQIFPVSFCSCFHRHGTQPGLPVVCLIWLEFPPPPTWLSPRSLERSGPGVLTSTPYAGLGDHATCHLEQQEEAHGKPAAQAQLERNKYLLPRALSLGTTSEAQNWWRKHAAKAPSTWPFPDQGALTSHHRGTDGGRPEGAEELPKVFRHAFKNRRLLAAGARGTLVITGFSALHTFLATTPSQKRIYTASQGTHTHIQPKQKFTEHSCSLLHATPACILYSHQSVFFKTLNALMGHNTQSEKRWSLK